MSIQEHLTHEMSGLETFEEAIEIALNKPTSDALSRAQIIL